MKKMFAEHSQKYTARYNMTFANMKLCFEFWDLSYMHVPLLGPILSTDISETDIEIKAWISNSIHIKLLGMITEP